MHMPACALAGVMPACALAGAMPAVYYYKPARTINAFNDVHQAKPTKSARFKEQRGLKKQRIC